MNRALLKNTVVIGECILFFLTGSALVEVVATGTRSYT